MSSPNQLPARLRYLKSRLQPLTQPLFLVSTVILGSLAAAGWQYLKNPDAFSFLLPQAKQSNQFEQKQKSNPFEETKPTPTLSAEELAAIGIDIDSSRVLIDEFNKTDALSSNTLPENDPKKSNSGKSATNSVPGLLGAKSEEKSSEPNLNITSPQKPDSINPFAKSVQDALNFNPLSGGDGLTNLNNSGIESSGTGSGTTDPVNPNGKRYNSIESDRNIKPTSALQEAMNRAAETEASRAQINNLPTNIQNPNLPNYTNPGLSTTSPATGVTRYNQTKQFNYNYPPTNTPGVSGYNGAGQPTYTYPPATGGGVSGYNGAGQPTYSYPPTTGSGVSSYNTYPSAPTGGATYPNPGQYSTQTPNNPGLSQSGLQQSQLSGGGRK